MTLEQEIYEAIRKRRTEDRVAGLAEVEMIPSMSGDSEYIQTFSLWLQGIEDALAILANRIETIEETR